MRSPHIIKMDIIAMAWLALICGFVVLGGTYRYADRLADLVGGAQSPAPGPCGGAVTISSAPGCAPLTALEEQGLKPKDTFRECAGCPEMVVVPAGSFTMGSPNSEGSPNEGPQHVVTIDKPFAVGKLHVTVDQFGAFVRETGYDVRSECYFPLTGVRASWRNPGFTQEGSHPVVCVGWNDANAYVDWLARRTGKPYHLLSEAEWEYAARGRTSPGAYPRFWFGDDEKDLCQYGNGADRTTAQKINKRVRNWGVPCRDGYAYTSPAGHYAPNAFGLYDMAGNAWQWTADCYHDSYDGAPADGSAWTAAPCGWGHVIRGGCWYCRAGYLRAAQRLAFSDDGVGFRLARTLLP